MAHTHSTRAGLIWGLVVGWIQIQGGRRRTRHVGGMAATHGTHPPPFTLIFSRFC